MQVNIDKKVTDKELIVTIKFSSPEIVNFTEEEARFMDEINSAIARVPLIFSEGNSGSETACSIIKTTLFNMTDKVNRRINVALREGIRRYVEKNIEALCQEIFEWTLDKQPDHIKSLVRSFNPERYRVYFMDSRGPCYEDDD